jgi:hypothetical protein
MELFTTITAIITLAVINIYALHSHGKQAQEWQKERKDLYDRIMSKDIQEYKDAVEPVKIYKPVDHSEEAEYLREQEARKH